MPIFYRNSSVTDNLNNVYVVGSTASTTNEYDILVQKFDFKGLLLWENTFDGGAQLDDMGVALYVDDNYHVYVTGAAIQNTSDDFDLVVIKYKEDGDFQWAYFYDFGGVPVPYDAGTAITGDNSGGIYVTGVSAGDTTLADFVTLKLSSNNGNELWIDRYDYSNLNEVPSKIAYGSGILLVTGASQIGIIPYNSWELATIRYTASTGFNNGVSRTSGNSIGGVDEANDLTIDGDGYVYVLGATVNDSTGFDISLYKFDDNLEILWEQHFDGYGLEDKGYGLKTDAQSNVYAVGYVTNPNQGKNYSILKYDSTGTLQWSREFNGLANLDDEAVQLVVRGDRIFVTGAARNNANSQITTMGFTSDGQIFSVKTYDSPFGLNDKPTAMGIDLDDNLIIVGQIQENDTTFSNVTVKYNVMEKPIVPVYIDSVPAYNVRELIVRFDKSAMNLDAVDKKNFDAGLLKDFVHEYVIDSLNAKFPFDAGRLQTFKIFHRMTTADSLSITRLGDTIPVPAFWATLSVMMPEEYDLFDAIDSLNTMKPMVHYGEVNLFISATSVPNDPIYFDLNLQHGLQSTVYPDAHINIEPAWDIETGLSNIIVGVFDSPIYWAHPDFYVNSIYPLGSYEGSKIVDGWDYATSVPVNQISSPWDSHGTSVAGIIGAVRNNGEGIAGVAGGDFSVSNPNVSDGGVSLNSFGILAPYTQPNPPLNAHIAGLTTSAIAAIAEGAILSTSGNYGIGVHIQNHSWTITNNDLSILVVAGQISGLLSLEHAIETAWRNNSIIVASRGNNSGGVNNALYPACYNDKHVINVGASGTNGMRKTPLNGDNGLGAWSSFYGSDMDILAPGVIELVSAPYVENDYPFQWVNTPIQDTFPSGYSAFNGTSAAAPIVSGVVALMLSIHNTANGAPNNLTTEDVEHILQKTTYQSQSFMEDNPGDSHFNNYTESEAFGLINAGLAVQQVDYPNYYIRHFSNVSGAKSVSAPTEKTVTLASGNAFGVNPGTYAANEYLVTWNFNITLDNNEEIIDFWPLVVKSFPGFLTIMNTISTEEDLEFPIVEPVINGNNITFSVQSYAYILLHPQSFPANQLNHPIPYSPDGIQKMDFSFSLHIRINEELSIPTNQEQTIIVYPNPSSDEITLSMGDIIPIQIQVIDASGRLVFTVDSFETTQSNNNVVMNIGALQNGIYFLKVIDQNQLIHTTKILKK